jgi:hypothetical protein
MEKHILVIISFIKLILLKIKVRNVKFQIYEQWRVSSKPREVRWRGAAYFVYIKSKHATDSGALSFVYLKFYVSYSYF